MPSYRALKTFVAGSAGSRSSVRHRRDEDPSRTRLGAAARFEEGLAYDRAVVSGSPGLVRSRVQQGSYDRQSPRSSESEI